MAIEGIHDFRCKKCGALTSDPAQFKPVLCSSCYRSKQGKHFGIFGA
jgi:protein-arginine kinase activator protein McsA